MPEISDMVLAVLIGLATGGVLGLAARLGRFCSLAAIEDATYGGDYTRLRMWPIALGVAILGTHLVMATGYLDPARIFYLTGWSALGAVAGGLLFGVGMALAGNCGFGALARVGGGDFRSGVVVVTMGIAAYAAISGPLAEARMALFPVMPIDPGAEAGLALWFQRATGLPALVLVVPLAAAMIYAGLRRADWAHFRKYAFWATAVGLVVPVTWTLMQWLSLRSFEAVPVSGHSFAAPLGETILYVMTSSGSDMSFGIGSVLGVVAGAAAGSALLGHFRWEACDDARELGRQLAGASMMGVGAVLAMGCSIGQGLTAFSVLSFGAPITLVSIFVGARLGLHMMMTGHLFGRAG